MQERNYTLLDRCLAELDRGLQTLAGATSPRRISPAGSPGDALSAIDQQESASLMRVNHAGEVAAQALYRGQAFASRDPTLREELLAMAADEQDHLCWCAERLEALNDRPSVLGPIWYAGSFALGAAAGLAGRATGLGFVAETERQVEAHLSSHLERLPVTDVQSRRIVTQIRADEAAHGRLARQSGGADLPAGIRSAMSAVARIMTTVAHRL